MGKHAHLVDICTTIRAHARVVQSLGWDEDANHYQWLRDAVTEARNNGAPWSLLAHSALCSTYRARKLYQPQEDTMGTLNTLFPPHPRDVTGEHLTAWADAVHDAIASGNSIAPLCFESGESEATYPDALSYALPELTMMADSGDGWGSVLGAFFPLASIIDAIGYAYDSPVRVMGVPSAWGYGAGAAGNTWESDTIPGEDAWARLAIVAHMAVHSADTADTFDKWMIEHDDASAAVDVAHILSLLTGEPLGVFPNAMSDHWESAVSILLAAGWCLNASAESIRRAGDDY